MLEVNRGSNKNNSTEVIELGTYEFTSVQNNIISSFIIHLSRQPFKFKLLYSSTVFFIGCFFYLSANSKLPIIDENAQQYFYSTSQQALTTYAASRSLNAILSTVEEMGLSLPILGEVPVGNLIEPIDDLTERLSTIMLYSISSLGLQKIIMEISLVYSFKLIAFCLPILIISLWIPIVNSLFSNFIFKTILILLVIRLFLPLSALANSLIQEEFFANKIQSNVQILSSISKTNEGNTIAKSKSESIFSISYAAELKEQTRKILANGTEIVNALIQLAILYSSSFIIQTLLIPLISFYILFKLFVSFVSTKPKFQLLATNK